jgi:hypothetical protein
MKFYFCWVGENVSFDEERHVREDMPVFSFEIGQQESKLPWMRLRVGNPRCGLNHFSQKNAFLSCRKKTGEIELLFKGTLICVAQKTEGESVELFFTAQPQDMNEKLEMLHQELKQTNLWDSLFVDPENKNDPSESLEARTQLFHWSRTTGELNLSDLLQGKKILQLKGNFYKDSLDVRLSEMPLQGVKVRLKVSWTQRFQGISDLTYLLRSRFSGGLVNTLTGEDLEAKWWRTGEKLGRSGYWIDHSELREVNPSYTGALNIYPATSVKVWASPHDPVFGKENAPRQVRLKRSWYYSKLLLGWRYKQKRTEYAQFFLGQKTQSLGTPLSKTRTLNISLKGLNFPCEHDEWQPFVRYTSGFHVVWENEIYRCIEPHRSRARFDEDEKAYWEHLGSAPEGLDHVPHASFFVTKRGHQAVAHALEIAKSHLAASARAVEVRFCAPLEDLMRITCDHTVVVEDPRLPGEGVQGKVTSYTLIGDGSKGIFRGEVVLGCCVGPKELPSLIAENISGELAMPYVQEGGPQVCASPSGILFESFYEQAPKHGLLNPEGMAAIDLVEEVRVQGLPDTQNAHLLANQYPQRHHILGALKEVKTNIFMRLKDLRSRANLKHTLYVNVLTPWQAPCQIDLSAPPKDTF